MADYSAPRPYPPLAPGFAPPALPVTLAGGFVDPRPYPPTAPATGLPAGGTSPGGTITAGSALDFSLATNSGLLVLI